MSLPWKWARTQINHLWKPFIDPSQNQIELVWSQLWKNLVPGRIHHVCGSKPWLQKFVQHAAQDGELKNIRSPASLLRPSPSPRKIHQRKAGCWTSTTRRSRCRLTWWPLWSLGIISRLNLTLSREVQSLRSPYIHSETNSILPHKKILFVQVWAPSKDVEAGRADYAAFVGPPLIKFYEDTYAIKWNASWWQGRWSSIPQIFPL